MTVTEPDLITRALSDAPQLLFGEGAGEGRVAQLGELLEALQGAAVRDVLAMRIEQIVKHGHDAERDDMMAIDFLPREAASRLQAAVDRLRGLEGVRNIPAARLGLVRATAMALAAIQRLDRAAKGVERG